MTPDRRVKSIVAAAASDIVRANSRHEEERYSLEQRLAKLCVEGHAKIEQRHERRIADILGPLTEPMRAAARSMAAVLEMIEAEPEEPAASDVDDPNFEEAAE